MTAPAIASAPTAAEDFAAIQPGMKVLVVDDSRLQRRILRASLARWGFDVAEAESGEAALNILREQPVDIVLSDWMMPGMTGLELCAACRDMGRDRYVYFILLTSKSAKEEVVAGLNGGADDFLTKPVSGEELLARMRAGVRILGMESALMEKNSLLEGSLREIESLYAAINRDLEGARQLQESLVPKRRVTFGDCTVSMLLRPSGHVGGDLVGAFPVNDDCFGIYAIDVSGHGISSALLTARIAAYLSAANPAQNVAVTASGDGGYRPRDPASAAAELNRLLLSEFETDLYFTMGLAIFDRCKGRLDYVQAGHPDPILLDRDGLVRFTGTPGPPVGLLPGSKYDSGSLHLRAGDRFIFHSDGFTECPDAAGNLLGETGLASIISANAHRGGVGLLDAAMDDLLAHAGSTDLPDDVSAVMLTVPGAD